MNLGIFGVQFFQQDVFVDICPVGSWIFSAHTQERGQG